MNIRRIYRERKESVVIFTASTSVKGLYGFLKQAGNACCIAVPENRLGSQKISEIQAWCMEENIVLMVHPKGEGELRQFNKCLLDAGLTFALSWNYSQIIKKETLDIFPSGIWNMHGGKIPEYRGAHVLQWAIANGEEEAGVTWHLMDERIDHGLILKADTVPIEKQDNAIDVGEKIDKKGLQLFADLWRELGENGVLPYEVDMSAGCYWKSRNPFHGIIRRTMAEEEIRNLLRAQCPPWPAPFAVCGGIVYRVHGIAREKGMGVVEYTNEKCSLLLWVDREEESGLIEEVLRREASV